MRRETAAVVSADPVRKPAVHALELAPRVADEDREARLS